MKYSCIIPIYNEQARIGNVLTEALQIKNVSEIICIDDGSTDASARTIKKNFPHITLIQHKRNVGKTRAIITGLKYAKHESILLLDSDLLSLKSRELDRAIASFEHNNLDCLLLNTVPRDYIDKLLRSMFRFLLLAAGNRIIRKQSLQEVFKRGNFRSYDLEIAQNRYLMVNNKNVAYFDVSAVDVSKIFKDGFIKGLQEEIEMWWQMISFAGLLFFIKQSLFFSRRKVC